MKKLFIMLPILFWVLLFSWCWTQQVIEQVVEYGNPIVITEEPVWIVINAQFTQDFIDNYQYEDSEWYMFAINIDWYYYNTFRKDNGWVGNSRKHWLTWAIPAYKFKEWVDWYIPFKQIKLANKDTYWFHYMYFVKKDSYDIKISPVKEWVETHHISYEFYY